MGPIHMYTHTSHSCTHTHTHHINNLTGKMLITSQTPSSFFRKLLENVLYQHKAINQEKKRKELDSRSTQSKQETQRIKRLVRTDF